MTKSMIGGWAGRTAGAGLAVLALAGTGLAAAAPASASVARMCHVADESSGGHAVIEIDSCISENGQVFGNGDADTFPGSPSATNCTFNVNVRDDTKGTTLKSATFGGCTANFSSVGVTATPGHRYHTWISAIIDLSNGQTLVINSASNVVNSPTITAN